MRAKPSETSCDERTPLRDGDEQVVYEDRSELRDWVDLDVMTAAPVGLRSSARCRPRRELLQPSETPADNAVHAGVPRRSPRTTPALYNLMSHVDFNLGVYYPDGGVGAVVDGLVDSARNSASPTRPTPKSTRFPGGRTDSSWRQSTATRPTPTKWLSRRVRPRRTGTRARRRAPVRRRLLGRQDVRAVRLLHLPRRRGRCPHSNIIRWSCRRTGTTISRRYSTIRRGPTTRRTTSVFPRKRTTLSLRKAIRTCSSRPHRAGAARRRRDPRGVPREGACRHR